jgi:hypothetical protein
MLRTSAFFFFETSFKTTLAFSTATHSHSKMDRCNAMVVVSQPPEKPRVIDIFAFHGITGHFQKTWTDKKSGANWLKDFLPIDLPNARVLSVCYDASICCNKVNNLRDISRIILARMVQVRPTVNEQQRAIILVSDSLGGLVCKQILITAHELSKDMVKSLPKYMEFSSLVSHTKGP